ncbi:MAG: hypothetical protein IJU75_04330 [Clostridia bacterium]|nr:hypothetical protein [Clostridia bacterium]
MKSKRFLCLLMAAAILILSAASCGEKQTYGDDDPENIGDVEPFEMPVSKVTRKVHVNRLSVLLLRMKSGLPDISGDIYIYGDPIEYNDYPLAEKMGFSPDAYSVAEDGRRVYTKYQSTLSIDEYGRFRWTFDPGNSMSDKKAEDELKKIAKDYLVRYGLYESEMEMSVKKAGSTYIAEHEKKRDSL